MKKLLLFIFSLFITVLLFGWINKKDMEQDEELVIGAASSLKEVMEELVYDFRKIHPDMKINLTFSATGVIRSQIEKGAKIDIFASANENFGGKYENYENIDMVVDTNSIQIFSYNFLVLIKNIKQKTDIKDLESFLENSNSKIAIGDPAYVPAGIYAKKILEKHSLWQQNSDNFVYTNNVRQVLVWVDRGIVPFGFVYKTDVSKAQNIQVIAEFINNGDDRIIYPIALTKKAKSMPSSKIFLAFLKSEKARQIIKNNGFLIP